jgi:hypothetical protein
MPTNNTQEGYYHGFWYFHNVGGCGMSSTRSISGNLPPLQLGRCNEPLQVLDAWQRKLAAELDAFAEDLALSILIGVDLLVKAQVCFVSVFFGSDDLIERVEVQPTTVFLLA